MPALFGPVVREVEIEQHLQAFGPGAGDAAAHDGQVGVALPGVQGVVPGGGVPEPQPYEVATVLREDAVGVFRLPSFPIHHAAILHLVHVGKVGAEMEPLPPHGGTQTHAEQNPENDDSSSKRHDSKFGGNRPGRPTRLDFIRRGQGKQRYILEQDSILIQRFKKASLALFHHLKTVGTPTFTKYPFRKWLLKTPRII